MNESRSLQIAFHGWRGLGSDAQSDLFFWRVRFGVVTVTMCRICFIAALQDARAEVARLQRIIDRFFAAKGDDKDGEGER